MRHLALAAALGLAGCASPQVPANKLSLPNARLMQPPASLGPVKPGDDLYDQNIVCRSNYGHETGKLRGIQGYVKTLHRE